MIFCYRQTQDICLLSHDILPSSNTCYLVINTHMIFYYRKPHEILLSPTHDILLFCNTWFSAIVKHVIFYRRHICDILPAFTGVNGVVFMSTKARIVFFCCASASVSICNGDQSNLSQMRISGVRHQMDTFSALLALCRWIYRSPVTSFTKAINAELWCFFYLRPKKWLIKKGDPSDLKHHRAHHDATVMWCGGVDNLSEAISLYIDITEKRHPVRALLCFVVNRYQHILPMFHCYFIVVWQTMTASETLNQPWRIHCRTRIRKIVFFLDIHWMYCDADICIYIYYIFFGIRNIFYIYRE